MFKIDEQNHFVLFGMSVAVKAHLLMLLYTNHHYWAAGNLPAIFLLLLISLGQSPLPQADPSRDRSFPISNV